MNSNQFHQHIHLTTLVNVKAHGLRHPFLTQPTRNQSENVLEVFHPISLEENQQDERPQAQDEAVRRMPVFLVGLLRRQGGVKEGEKEGLETTQIARERESLA